MVLLSDVLNAYTATALILLLLISWARAIGLVDRPAGHKHHYGEVPLVGGIAIFLGFIFSLITLDIYNKYFFQLLIPALILLGTGLIDDLRALSPKFRFVTQVAAGLFMAVIGGITVRDLGNLVFVDQAILLGGLSVPFTVICLVGLTNAINMSDGMDGLASALTLIALLGLAIVAYLGQEYSSFLVILLLGSSILAFMGFNMRFPWRSHAIAFMGDSGSMFLGFVLTWFTVKLSQDPHAVMTPVTGLWFVALPLFDMAAVMIRRTIKCRSPFLADREHLHHAFLLAGFSVNQTVLILSGIALLLVIVGIGGLYLGIPENVMFALFLGLFGVYFFFMRHAWTVMRFLRRSMCRRTENKDRRISEDRRQLSGIMYQGIYCAPDRRIGRERRLHPDRRLASRNRKKTLFCNDEVFLLKCLCRSSLFGKKRP